MKRKIQIRCSIALVLTLFMNMVVPFATNSVQAAQADAGSRSMVAIAAGGSHSLALKSDGTVVGWGSNSDGQTTVPEGLSGVVAIAAGEAHSLALKSDGTVEAWGYNSWGQTNVPAGLSGVVAIAGGYDHSLALKSDGTVTAWGGNLSGQTTVPAGLSGVAAIAAGRTHSLALKSDGTVTAWGGNLFGQTNVPAGLSGVVAIVAGNDHSLALKSDGTVAAWGFNGSGQTNVPAGLSGVAAIAGGGTHSLALKSDGTVVAWGLNSYGQTTVPGGLSGVVAIAAGKFHSLALKSDGTVVAWGLNSYGQTTVPGGLSGVAAIVAGGAHSLALKSDGTIATWGSNSDGQTTVPGGLSGVAAIAAGTAHSLALKSDGTVVAWGWNMNGQTNVPGGLSGVAAIAAGGNYSLALKSDGTVAAWGVNGYGQTDVPVGLSGVAAIEGGDRHSLALKSDGTIATWGSNSDGQTDVPAGLSGVAAIAVGGYHSLALKSDGTVVAWGRNNNGQTNVPAGLSGVVAIAGGYAHSLALKSDGTVVAWGRNDYGQRTVPGSADLSGLTIDAGALSPTFDPTVTGYTYQYVGPSVTSVNVTATQANSVHAALFVGGQAQTSGTVADVPLTGASTVISVRTEPYLQSGQTYTVTVLQDATSPTVGFGTDGSETWGTSASSMVTVTDSESGLEASALQYAWTTDMAVPASGWSPFASGDTLTKSGADGDWYVHIRGQDVVGNSVNAVSNRFRLDNSSPTVTVVMTTADGETYPDDTWTNQIVTVNVDASDANSVTSLVYSLDGGAIWNPYSSAIVLESDSVYALSFKAVDAAGNETALQRTAKISTSGLRLTPTLTKADGSAYTSGNWTNASVTVSVYAEAGASGLADLTYSLDGGAASTYVNETPITFEQEGTHTLSFQAADAAGSTLSALITVNIDKTSPTVGFGTNGSEAWGTSASSTVTVTDSESGVDASALQYAWTTDTTVPASGWSPFASGDTLTKNVTDGDWYLHIRAQDAVGNTVNAVSNRFRLDASAAELSGLSLSAGTLAPAFAVSTTGYTANVAYLVSSLTVSPASADLSDTVTVSVNDGASETVTSGSTSGELALQAGENTITVVVTAQNGAQNTYTIIITRAMADRGSTPGIDNTSKAVEPEAAPKLVKLIAGGITQIIDSSSVENITLPDGTVAEQVVLDEETLNEALALLKELANPILTIEVDDTEQAVQAQLPAAWIASVAQSVPNAVIEVQLNGSSFQLLVSVLDLEELAARLDVKLQDLKVNVIMERVDGQVKDNLEQIAASHGVKLVGSAVDYKITVEANGQSAEVRDFGGTYMARALVVKADEGDNIVTAVLYDPVAGTISFVPSVHATREDGTPEMVMSVPHNSIYAIMETEGKTFADLSGHWAKGDVELLASKLIVSGVTYERFAPDADITRAEFTALLVRALGLSTADTNAASTGFADVAANAWYAPAVEAATAAGLVSGLAPDRFAPDERITREQMAVIIARALAVAGGQADAESGQLDKFADQESISAWAKTSVAQAVAAGIITGMSDGAFGPSEYATRAQAAVMLKRFLQHVRFID